MHAAPTRRLTVLTAAVATAVGVAVAAAPPGGAQPGPAAAPAGVLPGAGDTPTAYDARHGVDAAQADAIGRSKVAAAAAPAAVALRTALGSQALVDMDGLTGTPRQVARLDGFLTSPSAASADTVARGYLTGHTDVFRLSAAEVRGLVLGRDYVDVTGTHHLSYQQVAGGVRLFGNGVKADVTKDGRLVQVTGSPVAGLTATALPAKASVGSAAAAIAVAKTDTHESDTAAGPNDSATPVLFRTAAGTRRGWQTVVMSAHTPTLDVVDAASGRLLYRSLLASDADPATPGAGDAAPTGDRLARVYDNWPGAALGGAARTVDLTSAGWLPAGSTTLKGNNVHTYTDVNDDNKAQASEEVAPTGDHGYIAPTTTFDVKGLPCSARYPCTWDPNVPNSWKADRTRTSAQNFYLISKFHDHLLQDPIGFTEAAGNFQRVNSTHQGKGGDAVEDQNLDGADTAQGLPDANHIDNANFATPPDGTPPTMQMYLWHLPGTTFAQDPFIAVNGADQADIVYHEYTHGLSHRLVVDADDVPALDSIQGGSMGEAWSDWYALDFLADQGYLLDTARPGEVEVGRYTDADKINFRSEPTDCPVGSTSVLCPGTAAAGPGGYTYGDFGKIAAGPEVHADGEIWAQTLWDIRSALGTALTESLVTRGMEFSPTFPSMLDMRNAILMADSAAYGGVHQKQLWSLFAARGMGYFAGTVTGDDTSPVQSFATPSGPNAPKGAVTGRVTDRDSGKPVAGVRVALGGHDSGLPGADFVVTTGANGRYTISGVPAGTYPDLYAIGAGYDLTVKRQVRVTADTQVAADLSVLRDWASSSGGGSIAAFTGVDYSNFGCGPAGDIDQSLGIGWGSVSNLEDSKPTGKTPKYIVIALPRSVDVRGVSVDPSNTCGDGLSAATGDYRVDVSRDGTTFTTAAKGTFTTDDVGRLNPVTLSGDLTGVTAVRFWMVTPQLVTRGLDCTAAAYSGCLFMDSSEVEVYGKPAAG